jgi:hypothetical protein
MEAELSKWVFLTPFFAAFRTVKQIARELLLLNEEVKLILLPNVI